MFTFRLLLSYIIGLKLGMGAIGVWIAMIVDWVFRAIAFCLRLSLIHILYALGADNLLAPEHSEAVLRDREKITDKLPPNGEQSARRQQYPGVKFCLNFQ